jgi:hypothetical protein
MNISINRRIYFLGILAVIILFLLIVFFPLRYASALTAGSFGSGSFGNCNFGSCSITITTSGSTGCSGAVCLNITPTSSGQCSVNSDSVSVQTQYSGGYSLMLNNTNTSAALTNGSTTIQPTGGTFTSPVALSANTWGYREDSVGSFGSGPTIAQNNVSMSSLGSLPFAQTPVSSGSPDTLISTNGPSNINGDSYTIWYGLCADINPAYGTYTSNVTYTATTN